MRSDDLNPTPIPSAPWHDSLCPGCGVYNPECVCPEPDDPWEHMGDRVAELIHKRASNFLEQLGATGMLTREHIPHLGLDVDLATFEAKAAILVDYGWWSHHEQGWWVWWAPFRGGTSTRHVSARLRRSVFARDRHACVQCGATEDLAVDHIWPVSKGGFVDDHSNLQTLCRPCNSRKHATLPDYAVRRLAHGAS